jgi:hypothetical protein
VRIVECSPYSLFSHSGMTRARHHQERTLSPPRNVAKAR